MDDWFANILFSQGGIAIKVRVGVTAIPVRYCLSGWSNHGALVVCHPKGPGPAALCLHNNYVVFV